MRVVVGKPYRKTPVFSEKMQYLVINPFWNVPTKLAVEDLVPKICADPVGKQSVARFYGTNAPPRRV